MAFLQWLKEVISLQTLLPSPLIPSIFLVVLSLIYLSNKKLKKKNHFNLLPSPPKLPIIGNLHQLTKNPHISLFHLSQKYGPIFFLQLGEVPTIIISSAKLAKEVLKTHDLSLANRPQIYSAKYLFYNCTDMAFSPYGAYWRNIRKICILELLSAKRVQSFNSVRVEEVARMVGRVTESNPGPINLSKIIARYANDVLCKVAFGRGFSEGGEYDRHGFEKMLEEYQILLGGFSVGDFYPSMEWVHSLTGMKSRLINTFTRFDRLFDDIIKEHRNPNRQKEEQKDLVDVLLDIQKKGASIEYEMSLTMDNVKALILDTFAAGTDTTFITLDWAMTELVMNPRALKKAQEEVRSITKDRTVLESELPQMDYLKAVIKEVFRLHPPAPVLLPRESMEEVTIDEYKIPSKTRFFVNAWAVGRDPESWDEPNEFKPERFIGSSIDYKGQDYELIPFGAGRRSCPAITFGAASVELALAQLLYSFDWELPPGKKAEDLDMAEVFGITMHRTDNLVVVAEPYLP